MLFFFLFTFLKLNINLLTATAAIEARKSTFSCFYKGEEKKSFAIIVVIHSIRYLLFSKRLEQGTFVNSFNDFNTPCFVCSCALCLHPVFNCKKYTENMALNK